MQQQQSKRDPNKKTKQLVERTHEPKFITANRKPSTKNATTPSQAPKRKNVWSKVKNSIQDKSLFTRFSIELEHEQEWQTVDMGKIIADSWELEKADLSKSLDVEITPDFFTPKKQVEQLEKTSHELNNIATRVTQTLLQYETSNNQDDVFQLLEEDDDIQFTAGFDRKSIMEESKGKVKVLIVDHNKLGLKRENILGSLKEWFEEMKNENIGDVEEVEEDDDTKPEEDVVNSILAQAHATKDKLIDIHSDLIEYASKAVKDRAKHNIKAPLTKTDNMDHLNSVIDKLTNDLELAVARYREAEGKLYSTERLLEKREEELKLYRQTDSSKSGQMKEDLFAFQQFGQQREQEIARELDLTKAKLEKAQRQIDIWTSHIQHEEPSNNNLLPDFSSDEFKEMYLKNDIYRRQLEAHVKILQEELNSQHLIKEKEIQMIRARQEEHFNERLSNAKKEHKEEQQKLKLEHMNSLQKARQEYHQLLDSHLKSFESAVIEPDSKRLLEYASIHCTCAKLSVSIMKQTYQEQLDQQLQGANQEIADLKDSLKELEQDINSEWETKMQLVIETHEAEKEKLKSDAEARLKQQVSALQQELNAKQANVQIASNHAVYQLKKTLGNELKELHANVLKKEAVVAELTAKVELLNDLVQREYNKLEKELNEKEKSSLVSSNSGEDKSKGDKVAFDRRLAEFTLEKKKAVELAQHKMKLEKEAAISALTSKFEMEKEDLIVREKNKALLEQAKAIEQVRHELALEKETAVQLLKDELEILKQQLDKERATRVENSNLAEQLKIQKQRYEKIIADMKRQQESNDKIKENILSAQMQLLGATPPDQQSAELSLSQEDTIDMLKAKISQLIKENEVLKVEAKNNMHQHGTTSSPRVGLYQKGMNRLVQSSSIGYTPPPIYPSPLASVTPSATEQEVAAQLDNAPTPTEEQKEAQLPSTPSEEEKETPPSEEIPESLSQLHETMLQAEKMLQAEREKMLETERLMQIERAQAAERLLNAEKRMEAERERMMEEANKRQEKMNQAQAEATQDVYTSDALQSATEEESSRELYSPHRPLSASPHSKGLTKVYDSSRPRRNSIADGGYGSRRNSIVDGGHGSRKNSARKGGTYSALVRSISAQNHKKIQELESHLQELQEKAESSGDESAIQQLQELQQEKRILKELLLKNDEQLKRLEADNTLLEQKLAAVLAENDRLRNLIHSMNSPTTAIFTPAAFTATALTSSASGAHSPPKDAQSPKANQMIQDNSSSSAHTPAVTSIPLNIPTTIATTTMDSEVGVVDASTSVRTAYVMDTPTSVRSVDATDAPTRSVDVMDASTSMRSVGGFAASTSVRPVLDASTSMRSVGVLDVSASVHTTPASSTATTPKRETVSNAPDSARTFELEKKAEALEAALQECALLQTRALYLEQQLEINQQLTASLEATNRELSDLVDSLEAKLKQKETPKATGPSEEALMNQLLLEERKSLLDQNKSLEQKLLEAQDRMTKALEQAKAESRKEIESINEQNEKFVEEISEGFKRRIKGLTDALTACLNDNDVIEELKKDNEETIKNAKLMNERAISRVRENMKRLEDEHKTSLVGIQESDRNELKRMHSFIQQLKHEFAQLLEEEKRLCLEGEEKHAEFLESLTKELFKDSPVPEGTSEALKEEGEFKDLIDTGIDTMYSLYSAMVTVLKHRRETSAFIIQKKMKEFDELQEEMNSKTKDLLASKNQLLSHEKTLSKLKSEQSAALYNTEASVADLKAKLIEQDHTIRFFKDKHREHERTIVELLNNAQDVEAQLHQYQKMSTEQKHYILKLEAYIQQLKRQMLLHGQQPPAAPAMQSTPISSMHTGSLHPLSAHTSSLNKPDRNTRHNTVHTSTLSFWSTVTNSASIPHPHVPMPSQLPSHAPLPPLAQQPINRRVQRERGHPQRAIKSALLPVAQGYGYNYNYSSNNPPREVLQHSPSYKNVSSTFGPPLNAFSVTAASQQQTQRHTLTYDQVKSVPFIIRSAGGNHSRPYKDILESVWSDMQRLEAQDAEEKHRREIAVRMFKEDRKIRQQKVGVAFAKLRERYRLKIVRETIATRAPSDKLAQVLAKMEQRHQAAIEKWESKRQELVELRKQHWLQVLQAVSDVVEYRKVSSIQSPFVMDSMFSRSMIISGYDGAADRTAHKSDSDNTANNQEQQRLEYNPAIHIRSFPQQAAPSQPIHKVASAHGGTTWQHFKAILEFGHQINPNAGYDQLLNWPGIEGKAISLRPSSERHPPRLKRDESHRDASHPQHHQHHQHQQQQQQQQQDDHHQQDKRDTNTKQKAKSTADVPSMLESASPHSSPKLAPLSPKPTAPNTLEQSPSSIASPHAKLPQIRPQSAEQKDNNSSNNDASSSTTAT